jgi:putative transcriptional regulator
MLRMLEVRRRTLGYLRCIALLPALCAAPVNAQHANPANADADRPNGVFLIARPGLLDPNFSQTVVLVTQTPDDHTLGVILNRPGNVPLAKLVPPGFPAAGYRDAVHEGGPVMRQALVAVFESDVPPAASAFAVRPGLYLSMHPDNLRALLESSGRRYRLYAGFAGWAPGQLQGELLRAGWLVLPADTDTVFRGDTGGLWKELLDRASGLRTHHK